MKLRLPPLTLGIFVVASLAIVPTAQAGVITYTNNESAAEVRNYWTADRMRSAKPVDRLRTGPVPTAGKPAPSAATSTEVTTISGALTAHGKVFFTDSGTPYVCSGTALVGDVVWTAGHCVNEGPGINYTNFNFVPAYRDGVAPYGEFPAPTLMTTSGWSGSGEFGVDVGAAIPSTNGNGDTLSEAVVERQVVFNAARSQNYALYGYPAAKRFSGQRMRVCTTAWSRDDTSTTPDTMGVACDMTGGSSGGGWVTAAGQVASVVSYGYSNIKNVLFGPHLESEAQLLYTTAVAATP